MRPIVLVVGAVALVAGAALVFVPLHGSAPDVAVVEETPTPTRTPESGVLVDVVGAVAHPGVVRLPAGARVLDALLAAGGMTGDADLFALNKAQVVRDGMRIYVPHPGEPVPATGVAGDAPQVVDLNSASVAAATVLCAGASALALASADRIRRIAWIGVALCAMAVGLRSLLGDLPVFDLRDAGPLEAIRSALARPLERGLPEPEAGLAL